MKSNNVLLFNLTAGHNVADLSTGSNTWQIKNYEELAETVYVLFLSGKSGKKVIRNGRTIIISVGSGSSKKDLLKAPWAIYRIVKRKKIKVAFTYEQVYLWWFALIIRMMRKCRLILMPVTLPEMMYKISGRSLSNFFPIWFERILRRISSYFVSFVVAPHLIGEYKKWLTEDRVFKKKFVMVKKVVEEVPSPYFFEAVEAQKKQPAIKGNTFQILCVTRLKKEKLIDDVLKCLAELVKKDTNFTLHIIGEGEDKEYFKSVIRELGIENNVIFHGYLPLNDIIPFYSLCDVYISTLTGSALREVAIYGMPAVAYEMDWVKDTFKNGVNYIGVEPYNYHLLAEAIMNIRNNPELAASLRNNINKLGIDNWSAIGLCESYEKVMI